VEQLTLPLSRKALDKPKRLTLTRLALDSEELSNLLSFRAIRTRDRPDYVSMPTD
jgi:hypothetical protein